MRADLPSGTVTFLFTDVEGSTKLLQERRTGYSELLAGHQRALRDAFTRHGGVEVDTQGDSFFVAFQRASDALAAARDAQAAVEATPVRIRIGIHTGEPQLDQDRYVGMDVHRAARIMQAAHGGQVVLSQATVQLLDESLAVHSLGEHRLKDLPEPQKLYQLGDAEFPPLRSLNVTNLPIPATPLLGRERELAEVFALLSEGRSRLLTLTGPGGSGKTRLALEAAAELVPEFEHGVFWLDLAPLRDPSLVLSSLAQVLGAKDELSSHIADKHLVVLLDNVEHMLEVGPELASLLSACPNLKLLCTSREPLHLQAEQELQVAPLADQAAVELFSARAKAVRSEFEADEAVAEICRRLDNLPLALELAAARIKVLPLTALLERLSERLPLLTGGARDMPERQQTLRATIEWSYELLQEPERRLFARTAAFRGGFELEAAEQVCEAELDTLASLVDKSLLRREDTAAGPRFSMLETIAEYAREKLGASGESDDLHRRHAASVIGLAEQAADFKGPRQQEWLDRFEVDHENVRAALDWLEEAGETETALLLANEVSRFWWLRGHYEESQTRLEHLLATSDVPDSLRARTLWNLSATPGFERDLGRATRFAEEALALYEDLGDELGMGNALNSLGIATTELGEIEEAQRFYARALAHFRTVGDRHRISVALTGLSNVALLTGDYAASERTAGEVLALGAEIGDAQVLTIALVHLGMAALGDDRPGDASERFSRSLTMARNLEPRLFVSSLIGLGGVLASRDSEAAVRVFGASEAIAELIGYQIEITQQSLRRRALDTCRESIGEELLAELWAEGRAMSEDEAVDYACARVDAANGSLG